MSWAGRVVMAVATNALALWVANALFGGVQIKGAWAYLIGSAVLGFANAFVRPVLAILTLPFVIVTLGFFLLLIGIAMVALAAAVAPNFTVHGFWTYVGVVVIVWLVNAAAGDLVERTLGVQTRGPRRR